MMTRRAMLIAAGSAAASLSRITAAATANNPYGKRGLGAAPPGFGARRRVNNEAKPPVEWVDYCHTLGLGGVETSAPPTDPDGISRYRDKIASYDMHVIFNVRLPNTEADIPAFESGV